MVARSVQRVKVGEGGQEFAQAADHYPAICATLGVTPGSDALGVVTTGVSGMDKGEVAYALWRGHGLVLVDCNDSFERVTPPDMIGRPTEEVYVAHHTWPLREAMRQALDTGEAVHLNWPTGLFSAVPLPGRPGYLVTRFHASRPIPVHPARRAEVSTSMG